MFTSHSGPWDTLCQIWLSTVSHIYVSGPQTIWSSIPGPLLERIAIHEAGKVIRTRLREEGTKYNSFFQTLRTVPRDEGYRGLTTHLVRHIPNTAIVISTYQLVVYLLNG
ncbi:hypothetical protein JOQ06_016915 [Pogonophryne albipinna]|uniref:Uncharacterized protein n=1 Tax=Pogonophryne albipinna TaxID=1090488 RepID=A0AAD6B198_9TELE|nr:hypothetical protein JOQ06_016915 [Pogonophryne albipinna]